MGAKETRVAAKVREAADYVDRAGLFKGDFTELPLSTGYDREEIIQKGGRCCTLGVLDLFGLMGRNSEDDAASDFGAWLAEQHPRSPHREDYGDGPALNIAQWNDTKSRRKSEVVKALRGYADHLEEQA